MSSYNRPERHRSNNPIKHQTFRLLKRVIMPWLFPLLLLIGLRHPYVRNLLPKEFLQKIHHLQQLFLSSKEKESLAHAEKKEIPSFILPEKRDQGSLVPDLPATADSITIYLPISSTVALEAYRAQLALLGVETALSSSKVVGLQLTKRYSTKKEAQRIVQDLRKHFPELEPIVVSTSS